MKGALAVMIELALARRAGALRCSSAREELPSPRVALDAAARRASRSTPTLVGRDGADRQRAARRLPGQHQRDLDASAGARATPRARGWPTTRSTAPRPAIAALAAQPPVAARRSTASTFVEVASVTRIAAGSRRNVIPGPRRVPRQLPLRARAARRPRPRRGCASCAPATASCGSTRNAPSGAGRRSATALVDALSPPATCARRAQAGVDAGRRVRRSPGCPAVNFGPGRARAGPPPRRVGRDRRAGARLRGAGALRAHDGSSPVARRPAAPTRSCARREADARGCGPRRRRHRLRHRRAARGDAGVHPRGAGRGDRAAVALPARRRAARAARGDRRLGRAALRRRARPGHAGRSRRSGSKEADLPPRAGAAAATLVAVPTPAYPVYERGARVRRQAGARAAAARGDRLAARPRRRRRGDLARVALLWLNYPNNPTGARRAARAATSTPRRCAREHGFVLGSDEAYSRDLLRRRAAGLRARSSAT